MSNAFLRRHHASSNEQLYQQLKENPDQFKSLNDYLTKEVKPNACEHRLDASDLVREFVLKNKLHGDPTQSHYLLLNAQGSLMNVKSFPTSASVGKMGNDLLAEKGWTAYMQVIPAAQTENTMLSLYTKNQQLDKILYYSMNKTRVDTIFTDGLQAISTAEIAVEQQPLKVSTYEWQACHKDLNKSYPPETVNKDILGQQIQYHNPDHGQDGFQSFVDYYVNQEIKGLNYWHDREKVEHLLKLDHIDLPFEKMSVMTMDKKGTIRSYETVSEGSVARTTAYLDKIYDAVEKSTHFALTHNHPSGTARASELDVVMTQKIVNSFDALNKKMVDHLILAQDRAYSFQKDQVFSRMDENAMESKYLADKDLQTELTL